MSRRPWTPERAVEPDLARDLVAEQFPDLAGLPVEPFAVGWDNTAFLVGGAWVFRFPRREMAVDLIHTETTVLPRIAPALPLAVPVPERVGRPTPAFAWPWAGYRLLPGTTADRAGLDDAGRARAAEPLGRFLAALHAVPAGDARAAGAPPDRLRRLERGHRVRQVRDRLRQAEADGLVDEARAWDDVVRGFPADWEAGDAHLVHGDLYSRHVLVDPDGTPTGVIDWGDVHVGDPAIDLAIAWGLLPPPARGAFRAAYGPIDDRAWRVARFKALHSAVMVLVYGADVGDETLVREARTALRHVAAD